MSNFHTLRGTYREIYRFKFIINKVSSQIEIVNLTNNEINN